MLNPAGSWVVDQLFASSEYATVLSPSATITIALGWNVLEPSSCNPSAILDQFPPPNVGNTSAVQFSPSILTAPFVPAPTARNFPDCAMPAKSNSATDPVALLIDISVTVISFAGLAPPTSVPAIVNVSNLV